MGVPQRDFSSDYATGQLISKSFAILLEQRQSIGLSSPSSLGAHHALSRGMKKKVKMCLTFERNCGRRKMLVGQTAQTENGKKPDSEDLRSMLYLPFFLVRQHSNRYKAAGYVRQIMFHLCGFGVNQQGAPSNNPHSHSLGPLV